MMGLTTIFNQGESAQVTKHGAGPVGIFAWRPTQLEQKPNKEKIREPLILREVITAKHALARINRRLFLANHTLPRIDKEQFMADHEIATIDLIEAAELLEISEFAEVAAVYFGDQK